MKCQHALVLKGAIHAGTGDYDDGVKYLNVLECANQPWSEFRSDDVPTRTWQKREHVLDHYWKNVDYASEEQQALSEWCGYPNEFIADPAAGVWATVVANRNEGYFWNNGLVSINSRDALVVKSNNVGLLLYMTKLYGLRQDHSMDAVREIERVIELDPSIADAYRVKAELYLTTNIGSQGLEERYEQAVAAWKQYESLATPEPAVAADHHFARGAALAALKRKEEAQTAYQKAFELGYDEDKVQKALVQLNQ